MTEDITYTQTYTEKSIPCLVCKEPLRVKLARGRNSGKPFVMLICSKDGRHFRAFINDQEYVSRVLESVGDLSQNASQLEGHESDLGK